MIKLLKKIEGLPIAPVSDGADRQNEFILAELPFKVLNYKSGSEHNGWVVPDKWEVLEAEIRKNGKLIYDGKRHPLGVIGSSESFSGKISLTELKKHLFYKPDAPDNIVYHCDLYYKPFRKLWGFSIPFNLYKKLEEGEYEINLKTKHTKGVMKVLEYAHRGSSAETIILNAHNCHAAQLNDGPSGFTVFIEVMKRLREQKTRLSYKLIIAPEHIGTVFYLANLPKVQVKKFKAGIFMEMVGHDNPRFALQESFTGNSLIDRAARHVLGLTKEGFWSAPFRKILGNDETVWEAPGIEVPMISLSRCGSANFYYSEYHLDSDNLKIIKEKRLDETAEVIMKIINLLEKNYRIKRKFTGLIALSNSKFDLYRAPGTDPSQAGEGKKSESARWNYLMDCLPRYFDGKMTVLDIAEKHELPFEAVFDYLLKFKEKGLIKFI